MPAQAIEQNDQIFRLFNMKLEEVSQGRSLVSMPVADCMLNGMGIVHGGALFSLADIAFGAAANYGSKTGTVTVSSHICYLAAGRKGPITAEANCVRAGKHVVVYDVEIRDADKVLLAKGTFEGFRTETPLPAACGSDSLCSNPQVNAGTAASQSNPAGAYTEDIIKDAKARIQAFWDKLGDANKVLLAKGTPEGVRTDAPLPDSCGRDSLCSNPQANAGTAACQGSIPAGFDAEDFLNDAKVVYTLMQVSWDKRDLEYLSWCATPAIIDELRLQMADDPTPSRTEIVTLNAALVNVQNANEHVGLGLLVRRPQIRYYPARAQVCFEAQLIKDPGQTQPVRARELWTFVRDHPSDVWNWELDAIQQV